MPVKARLKAYGTQGAATAATGATRIPGAANASVGAAQATGQTAVQQSGLGDTVDIIVNIIVALTGVGILALVVLHPTIPGALLKGVSDLFKELLGVGSGKV